MLSHENPPEAQDRISIGLRSAVALDWRVEPGRVHRGAYVSAGVWDELMDTRQYLELRKLVIERGYAQEIDWAQSLKPIANALTFWTEFTWVVLNSGMKNQIAAQIWKRVYPAVINGGSAGDVFGHKGKSAAIDYVFANRSRLLTEYQRATNKLEWLQSLPWIGRITCWHLAKNYGHDCAKPDRHLVRIAGKEGVQALCKRLSIETGDRIATVDLVIWRAANLGLIDTLSFTKPVQESLALTACGD